MKDFLEIIKPGLLTSIQDLGRKGLAFYAMPQSGVMDVHSAKIALLLLRKKTNEPVIECTSLAPEIKFHGSTKIAISGADFQWTLNEIPVNVNSVHDVKPGDLLKGKFAKEGMRGYIAIQNRLDLDQVFGSYSTYNKAQLGGFQGRMLQKGDEISWLEEQQISSLFRIYKGPEFEWLHEDGKEKLFGQVFKIANETDRMGMRLQGEKLSAKGYQLAHSSPVLPGFIQLPPSGLPIIVLQDGQTTGGYPRIAYLRTEALPSLNQLPIGSVIRFDLVD